MLLHRLGTKSSKSSLSFRLFSLTASGPFCFLQPVPTNNISLGLPAAFLPISRFSVTSSRDAARVPIWANNAI